jgi:hypothetical protein
MGKGYVLQYGVEFWIVWMIRKWIVGFLLKDMTRNEKIKRKYGEHALQEVNEVWLERKGIQFFSWNN